MKFIKIGIIILVVLLLSGSVFLFVGSVPQDQEISWGVNFSKKHTVNLGLDWQATYLALLDDLGVRHLKIAAHWDDIHPNKDEFSFSALDWQMEEAGLRGADVLLVIGMKTPRWPECHIPSWAEYIGKEAQQEAILVMLEKVVERYKDNPALSAWQVENEPFFIFGTCPWKDDDFLEKEVELVHSLDPNHPIIISDSGEFSFWTGAARIGDIVGTTMYRKVWFAKFGMYVSYPFPSVYYARKANIIQALFGKKVIGVEVQAEPWGPRLMYDTSMEEQRKTMTKEKFLENIEFAKNTGFDTLYLWGGEWWYWMREVQGEEGIWNEARKVFSKD